MTKEQADYEHWLQQRNHVFLCIQYPGRVHRILHREGLARSFMIHYITQLGMVDVWLERFGKRIQ